MHIDKYPFHKLPFSDLFKTYVDNFSKVASFFETDPFYTNAIQDAANQHEFSGQRAESVEILREINRRYDPHEKALNNIDRLEQSDALVIVTGQQLCVYGGPLYTVFKTLSTIHLAKHYEELLDRPVIPVFWLADEDHDYSEVKEVTVIGRKDPETIALPDKTGTLPPVAELIYSEDLETFKKEVSEVLYETDFSDELWSLLDTTFEPGKRLDYAFGEFITRLFSKHGLVLAGSNHPAVKSHTKACMQTAIREADELREALEQQSEKLKQDYHQQVTLYDSNLFFLDSKAGRVKISRNGDGWKTESGKEWTTDELLEDIEKDPDAFSPNVFLRPVMQDFFLPTLGYVAGPGETAYYAQMKHFYHAFDMSMPVIFPRMSGTLVEPAIDRILQELPFEFHEYHHRIEDLESDFVDRTEQVDIEAIFKNWKQSVQQISEEMTETIVEVDSTLEGAAGKATSVYMGELDKLKGKVYRSVKQQEKTQLNRIQKIKAQLFPGGGLQERGIASIYFMNKYGVDIWDQLLENLEENESFNSHKIITL